MEIVQKSSSGKCGAHDTRDFAPSAGQHEVIHLGPLDAGKGPAQIGILRLAQLPQ